MFFWCLSFLFEIWRIYFDYVVILVELKGYRKTNDGFNLFQNYSVKGIFFI